MPIIRRQLDFEKENYTRIPNDWLRDERLSLKSKGLLAQLLSHAVGWKLSIETLAEANHCGEHMITTAVQELEANGYLKRLQTKTQNGKFGEVLWFTTAPGSPYPENPGAENPLAENPGLKNTNSKKTNVKKEIKIATRLPDSFAVTDEMREWAQVTVPGLDVDWHTDSFRDYWNAKSTNATKKDWVATWRNWMRNAADRTRSGKTPTRLSNAQRNMIRFETTWRGNHEENRHTQNPDSAIDYR